MFIYCAFGGGDSKKMCCRVVGKRKKYTDVCYFKIYNRFPQTISHLTIMTMLCGRQDLILKIETLSGSYSKERNTRLIEVK